MAETKLVDRLNATHPDYVTNADERKRYRAFGGRINSTTAKKEWLPKGESESPAAYAQRLSLTHNLGFSKAAVKRIAGVLTATAAVRNHAGGKIPKNIADRINDFEKDVDRTKRGIESFEKKTLREALTMGRAGVTVDKTTNPDATDESEDPLPYVTLWKDEEVIDWAKDDRGVYLWVKLRRDVHEKADGIADRKHYHMWRVYDRETVREWRQEFDPQSADQTEHEVTGPVTAVHRIGIVPYVDHNVMEDGESYIEDVSLSDLRKLQYDSDQAHASYTHGSPQLVVRTKSKLDKIGIGTSHVLKLDPDDNEDASYLENDPKGMEIRETLVESAVRQGFNLAGIDPAAVTQQESGGGARSGTSLAWSFSTAEAPNLGAVSDEMERFEQGLHEIVTRYLIPGDLPGPHDQVYDGVIERVRAWDLMSAERAVDLAEGAWDKVKSEVWRKKVAADLAAKIPGTIPEDVLAEITKEIEDSKDYEILPEPDFDTPPDDDDPNNPSPPVAGDD